jgi:hypothetical protein
LLATNVEQADLLAKHFERPAVALGLNYKRDAEESCFRRYERALKFLFPHDPYNGMRSCEDEEVMSFSRDLKLQSFGAPFHERVILDVQRELLERAKL